MSHKMKTLNRSILAFIIGAIATIATVTGSESKLESSALNEHNVLRALHGSPPLILDSKLSETAENWAKQLAAGKPFGHSNTAGLGENIYSCSGCGNCDDGKGITKVWYNEVKNYDFENGKSKNGKAVGHFTQVVWKRTTNFGIGKATANGQCWVVANYSPPGNYATPQAHKNNIQKPL